MCKKSKAKLKLNANLMVSPDTSRAVLTNLTTESGSFWTEAAVDCLRAVGDRMIIVECRHKTFNLFINI